jgi:type IV secretion system protein TrbL
VKPPTVPFGLFSKTAFLAERVLGNVVASGVKAAVPRRATV